MPNPHLTHLKLPDYITLAGLACAVASILFSLNQHLWHAYSMIVLQIIFDILDGRTARRYGGGKLGMYLDSFSDLTAIVATVVLGGAMGIKGIGMYVCATFFIICAAIRLSYFTVRSHEGKKDFIGLPTVFCSTTLSTLMMINFIVHLIPISIMPFLYGVFGYTMIANWNIRKIQ